MAEDAPPCPSIRCCSSVGDRDHATAILPAAKSAVAVLVLALGPRDRVEERPPAGFSGSRAQPPSRGPTAIGATGSGVGCRTASPSSVKKPPGSRDRRASARRRGRAEHRLDVCAPGPDTVSAYDARAPELAERYESMLPPRSTPGSPTWSRPAPASRSTSAPAPAATRRGSPPSATRWSPPSPPPACAARAAAPPRPAHPLARRSPARPRRRLPARARLRPGPAQCGVDASAAAGPSARLPQARHPAQARRRDAADPATRAAGAGPADVARLSRRGRGARPPARPHGRPLLAHRTGWGARTSPGPGCACSCRTTGPAPCRCCGA